MAEVFLDVRRISKAYEGVQALDEVSLTIGAGVVHCLVGENGSGKSTLIKCIGGVVEPDSGQISINGRVHEHLQAIDAIREGIQIIYQDLSLYPNVTVAENISLNQFVERRASFVNWKEVRAVAARGLAEVEEDIHLDAMVQNLSVAKRQIVAITRSLTQGAKLIIMDEPTSAITRDDVDHLFTVIARLKKKGISTLFISHKLSEVFEIADAVTILRDGKKVGDFPAAELDDRKLTFLMTGRDITYTPYRFSPEKKQQTPVLEVRSLSRTGHFQDVSFSLWPGEILGLTGLIGSGRTELALALFGLNRPDSGQILLNGKPVHIRTPEDAVRLGIGYLPGGSPDAGPVHRPVDRRQHGDHGAEEAAGLSRTAGPGPDEEHGGRVDGEAVHQGAVHQGARLEPLRRQPAARGAGQVAGHEPQGVHPGRADHRHRHLVQEQHPRDHPQPRRAGHRDHRDLRRDPRDPPQLQPGPRDA